MEHLIREIRKTRQNNIDPFPKSHEIEKQIEDVLDLDLTEHSQVQLKQFIVNNYTVLELRFNLSTVTTQIKE